MKITKISTAALIACVALFAAAGTADAQVGRTVSAKVFHGDANADGVIDLADIRVMYAILFEGTAPFVSQRDLDHDGDGKFDLEDVNAAGRELLEFGPRRARESTERAIVGDTNDDGRVNVADLSALAGWLTGGKHYGAPEEAADMNGDGRVDISDLSILAGSLAR